MSTGKTQPKGMLGLGIEIRCWMPWAGQSSSVWKLLADSCLGWSLDVPGRHMEPCLEFPAQR